MQKIKTYLWFDNNAEEAINLYKSIFKDVKITSEQRQGPGGPLFVAEFTMFGQEFVALNGGPQFKFNEAMSLFVTCEDQKEVDNYWSKLTADGGAESMCGWCHDKFGLWWQIIPKQLMEYLGHKDREKSGRAMQAMLKMKKIDVKKLQDAFEGK